MKVRYCGDCKRLILDDFAFCPYCGTAVPRGLALEEALESPFARLETGTLAREGFAQASHRLDELEADMNSLLEGVEARS